MRLKPLITKQQSKENKTVDPKKKAKTLDLTTDEVLDYDALDKQEAKHKASKSLNSDELISRARVAMDKILNQPQDYWASIIYGQTSAPSPGTPAFDNFVEHGVSNSPIKASDSKYTKLAKEASKVGLRLCEGWSDPNFCSEEELEKRIQEVKKWNNFKFKSK